MLIYLLLFKRFISLTFYVYACLAYYVCMCPVSREPKSGVGTGVKGSCQPSHGCWEHNRLLCREGGAASPVPGVVFACTFFLGRVSCNSVWPQTYRNPCLVEKGGIKTNRFQDVRPEENLMDKRRLVIAARVKENGDGNGFLRHPRETD